MKEYFVNNLLMKMEQFMQEQELKDNELKMEKLMGKEKYFMKMKKQFMKKNLKMTKWILD